MNRLAKQIEFILEIDKLKGIIRRSYLTGVDRLENSAEHSWHVAMLAIILAEHCDSEIDLMRVLKMLLIHDVVEIDAGDTYFFDSQSNVDKADREAKAADRLFGLLPEDQAREFRQAWNEFEARQTSEAKFAYALDRFIPVLHSYHTEGRSWKQHGIRLEQVLTLNDSIKEGSRTLFQYASELFQDAVEKGYLKP
jgi:putative hydrolase of HD superfamily